MGLLDLILGGGGGGGGGGPMIPADIASNMVNPSASDTLGNVVGGPAPGAPMPQPRPPDAGPGAADMGLTGAPTGLPMGPGGAPGGMGSGGSGLLDAILGPGASDRFDQMGGMRRVAATLAGGLKSINGQPFAGQAFGNAMGGSLEGGTKFDDNQYKQRLEALDRALKLRQIDQLGSYRDDMSDVRRLGVGVQQQNADTRASIAPSTIQRNTSAAGASDARAGEAPSRIALNNSRIDLNGARVAGADRTSLMQADSQADRWRAETGKTLRQAKQTIMQDYSLRPEQKQTQLAAVDQKLQDADNQYFEMKKQNRLSRGLGEDGKPMPKAGKGPGPQGSAAKPGEISMNGKGSRDAPYEPASEQDFADMDSGTYYRDPGDGKLYQKP